MPKRLHATPLLARAWKVNSLRDGEVVVPSRQLGSVRKAGELRVDPHPAWDNSWHYVAFTQGTRRVHVVDLAGELG